MGLSDLDLDVRRLRHKPTSAERKADVQSYVVERIGGDMADEAVTLVDWVGAGGKDSHLHCHRCGCHRPAEPACADIEAVRVHLGFRVLP